MISRGWRNGLEVKSLFMTESYLWIPVGVASTPLLFSFFFLIFEHLCYFHLLAVVNTAVSNIDLPSSPFHKKLNMSVFADVRASVCPLEAEGGLSP